MKQDERKNGHYKDLLDWGQRDTAFNLPAIEGRVVKTADGYVLVNGDTEQWLGKTMEEAAAKIDVLRLLAQLGGGSNG